MPAKVFLAGRDSERLRRRAAVRRVQRDSQANDHIPRLHVAVIMLRDVGRDLLWLALGKTRVKVGGGHGRGGEDVEEAGLGRA